MSKADEMFKELGYEKQDVYEDSKLICIKFRKRYFGDEYQNIIFDLNYKLLNINRED